MIFNATFGVVAGYGGHTYTHAKLDSFIAGCMHEAISYVRDLSGVVVGCVVSPARVFYPFDFGCPHMGETVIIVSGAHNPKYGGEDSWRESVTTLVEVLKGKFAQERVTLTFSPSECVYFEDSPIEEVSAPPADVPPRDPST